MSNLFEAEFGGADAIAESTGVRTPAVSTNKAVEPAAPPLKASAAPGGNNKFVYAGLCATMNQREQELVKKGIVEFANVYRVELVGELKSAKLAIPGTVNKNMSSPQNGDTAKDKLDPDSNSMDTEGVIKQTIPGTQMIQFIEQIVRNSTYITDQQIGIIDSETGEAERSNSTAKNNSTKWFKISVYVVPNSPRIDAIRNDYAYDITYVVSPFALNQAESQYFPQATYRGTHKVYDYWFTGDNTQVLFFEQNYTALFFEAIDGNLPVNTSSNAAAFPGISNPWQNTRVPTTASTEPDKGATKGANNPSSALADYLYSQNDQARITLRIVGDPDWIQQGEVLGIDALSFNFDGFYPDGSINTDAQQAVFVLNWNAPADYDINTGLMNVNASATQGNNNNLQKAQPAQTAAYQVLSVKNTFSKGRFEQELTANLIKNLNQDQINQTEQARNSARRNTTPNSADVRTPNSAEPAQGTAATDNVPQPADSSSSAVLPANSSQASAAAPSSNGDIEDGEFNAPPVLSVEESNKFTQASTGVEYSPSEIAARDAYQAAGSPTAGPLYDAAVAAKSGYASRVAALAGPPVSAAPPQTTEPRDQ